MVKIKQFTNFFNPYYYDPYYGRQVKSETVPRISKQKFDNFRKKYELDQFINYETSEVKKENQFIHHLIQIYLNNNQEINKSDQAKQDIQIIQTMLLAYLSYSFCIKLTTFYRDTYYIIGYNSSYAETHSYILSCLNYELFEKNQLKNIQEKYDPKKGDFTNYLVKNKIILYNLNEYFSKEYKVEIGQRSPLGTFRNVAFRDKKDKKTINNLAKEILKDDNYLIDLYYKTGEYLDYNDPDKKAKELNDINWKGLLYQTDFSSEDQLIDSLKEIIRLFQQHFNKNQKEISLYTRVNSQDEQEEGVELQDLLEDSATNPKTKSHGEFDKIGRPSKTKKSPIILINKDAKLELDDFINRNLNQEGIQFQRAYYQYYLSNLLRIERSKNNSRQEFLEKIFDKDQGTISRSETFLKNKCLLHLLSDNNLNKPKEYNQYYDALQNNNSENTDYENNIINHIQNDSLLCQHFKYDTEYKKHNLSIIEENFFNNLDSILHNKKRNQKIQKKTVNFIIDYINVVSEQKIKIDDPIYLNKINTIVKKVHKRLETKVYNNLDDQLLDDVFFEKAYEETYHFYKTKRIEENLDREQMQDKLFDFLHNKLYNIGGDLNNASEDITGYITSLEERLHQDLNKDLINANLS